MKRLAALKFRLERPFFCGRRSDLQFVDTTVRAWKRCAARASAHLSESRFEQNLLDGELDIAPNLFQAAVVGIGANASAFRVTLTAGRIGDAVVSDTQDITEGNFRWMAGELVTTVDAAATRDEAGATKLEENLFEVFYGDAIARCDFVNGDNAGMLHGEMENCSRRVLAFCRNSHAFGV